MFSSLKLFREILCPSASICQLPNCLYTHSSPELKESCPGSTPQIESSHSNPRDGSHDQDGPRKKRRRNGHEAKLSKPTLDPTIESASGRAIGKIDTVEPSSLHFASSGSAVVRAEVKVNSIGRPISPPPHHSRPEPSIDSHSKRANSTKPNRSEQRLAEDAPEALNPRILAKPPTSHSFRFTVVTKIHEELVRLNAENKADVSASVPSCILTPQELIIMTLDEEERVAISNPFVYSNVIKHRLMAFKKMTISAWRELVSPPQSVEPTLEDGASKVTRGGSPAIDTSLSIEEEIAVLPHLLGPLYEDNICPKNGYITVIPTEAKIKAAQEGVIAALHTETCDRCSSHFQVFPDRREHDGVLASGGKCVHHYGRAQFPQKVAGRPSGQGAHIQKIYTCCQQAVGESPGCETATTHVYKVTDCDRLASVMNFAQTPGREVHESTSEASPAKGEKERAMAVDCEMGYTTAGLCLMRVTATRFPSRECLIDVLVRPHGAILDPNTRFSGVSIEDLTTAPAYTPNSHPVETSIEDVQTPLQILASTEAARDLIFAHIDNESFLIGHGLENDLIALRIIHPPSRIIDTALLYRHRRGLPFRYGLKMLVAKHLERDIQTTADGKLGHDSKEDARAAGDLVRVKIVEAWKRMKGQGWTWIQDAEQWKLKAPEPKKWRKPSKSA